MKVKITVVYEYETKPEHWPQAWTKEQIIENVKDESNAWQTIMECDSGTIKVEITEE